MYFVVVLSNPSDPKKRDPMTKIKQKYEKNDKKN